MEETPDIPYWEAEMLSLFYGDLDDKTEEKMRCFLEVSEKHVVLYRRFCRIVLWIGWTLKEQQINEQAAYNRLRQSCLKYSFIRIRYVAAVIILIISILGAYIWNYNYEQRVNKAEFATANSAQDKQMGKLTTYPSDVSLKQTNL